MIDNILKKSIFNKFNKNYKECVKEFYNLTIDTYKEDLISIILGGSGGKNQLIDGWSDLDFYIILKKIDLVQYGEFFSKLNNLPIHIGVTIYTENELNKRLIDNKTKIMFYEKNNYDVNPTLYGKEIIYKITYDEIRKSDQANIANVLHDLRRLHVMILHDLATYNNKYFKKVTVLMKCYLNMNGIFAYGYKSVTDKFLNLLNKDNSLSIYKDFDIIKHISNHKESKEIILNFGEFIINYIGKIIEESDKMDKRIASRGIIIEGEYVWSMFRRKKKDDGSVKEYYVIPGGGLNENETLETNVIREIKEEFSVDAEIIKFLGTEENEKTIDNLFLCKIVNGDVKLGGEELDRCSEDNYYEPRKIKISEIDNYDISYKEYIKEAYKNASN